MKTLLLTLWMIVTVILTLTIVGMLLFIPESNSKKSTWMEIGKNLNASVEDNKSWYFFIIWILFTIILTCNVYGMLIFIPNDWSEPSTWMEMGSDITYSITKSK
jgi:uncharacterized BrkB/YihY/UPF0761 family membrane protein